MPGEITDERACVHAGAQSALPAYLNPEATPCWASYWLFQKPRQETDAEEWRVLVADANRYRYLREFCGHHYGNGYTGPVECGVAFEWQQGKPDERWWELNQAIDDAIARQIKRDLEDATEEGVAGLVASDGEARQTEGLRGAELKDNKDCQVLSAIRGEGRGCQKCGGTHATFSPCSGPVSAVRPPHKPVA